MKDSVNRPTAPFLILWDIDGTLMASDGAGRAAMGKAFLELFGVQDALAGIEIAGRTDQAILVDALIRAEVNAGENSLANFRDRYFSMLKLELLSSTRRPEPLPGIPSLLRSLDEDERYLCALLTGNWETSAYIKLGSVGLGKWFSFGAFAGEAPSREDLLPLALKRAQEYDGHATISPTQVAVIGDTPRDVAVARAHGAKSVAVATGIHSYGDLEAASPDLLLQDLAGPEIKDTLAIWACEG